MNNQEVVLITGCSTGIGRDMCNIMSDLGYIVVATARNIDTLEEVSASLKLTLDVTNRQSIDNAVDKIIQQYHKIDILVNNAGYSTRGAMEEIDINKVKQIFDVNVFGIIHMVQAVLPSMRKEKSGKIINIGSISGQFAQAINGSYCASKYSVEAISDALRLELNQYHIQSTVIEPGPMETTFFDTLSKTSDTLLKKHDSAYTNFHHSDVEFRKRQKRSSSVESARQMCQIMMNKNLKPRYQVAVPFAFKFLLKLPVAVKEFILLRR